MSNDPHQPVSPGPGWFQRLADGLRRRLKHVRAQVMEGSPPPGIEGAAALLVSPTTHDWVPVLHGGQIGSAAVTARAIATAWNYGFAEPCRRWADWLAAQQAADGLIVEPATGEPSLRATIELVMAAPVVRIVALRDAAKRAIDRLFERLARGDFPREGIFDPLTLRLACAAALGRYGGDRTPQRRAALCRAAESFGAFGQLGCWITPAETFALRLDGMDGGGLSTEAMVLWRAIIRGQRGDGRLPAEPTGAVFMPAGPTADLASIWYRNYLFSPPDRPALRAAADRAVGYLSRLQTPAGHFPPGDPAAGWAYLPVIGFLEASRRRVLASFEATAGTFPNRIEPEDGRAEFVRQWARQLVGVPAVADVGCGRGRFLQIIRAESPYAQLTGVDISQAMLDSLPSDIEGVRGSLLRVPVDDGHFDAALAIESLEHALLPERAVAELCRIVRPGGRLLIIDKHRSKQALSHYEPWERWFLPEELKRWLSPFCEAIEIRPVPHREGRPADDLFLAATARRKEK